MCYTDVLQRGYTCGATTGELHLLVGGQTTGIASGSSKQEHICSDMQASIGLYNAYYAQMSATNQPPLRMAQWAQQTQHHHCIMRICAGVVKYARHCTLDRWGRDACTRVGAAHKYRGAPGGNPIPLTSGEVFATAFLGWVS
ncbi:hypothetical protein B0H10DRAFT_1008662 [Mycena sp. CBHHK59/15]|nr:hypothetical protein B0H10DRAFT_1008662 [Mycena sp. CBHHK59/15]